MFWSLAYVDMRSADDGKVIRLHDVWENLAKLPISHKLEALERNACQGKVQPVKQHKGILLVA